MLNKEKKMKASKIFGTLAIGTAALMFGNYVSNAYAATFNVTGTVVSSQPKYVTQTRSVPTQVCNTVQVPVYSQNHNNGIFGGVGSALKGDADALVGALIGGAIGNKIGKGGGRDGATALGAIIGGNIATKNAQGNGIVGYREVNKCSTQYHQESNQVLQGHIITFEYNGMKGTTVRSRGYNVGDQINLRLSISAQ